LLIEGQPALQRSKIGIILDPDCQILTEIAREARGRHELRPAILSKPEVDDRVDDELVIAECLCRRDVDRIAILGIWTGSRDPSFASCGCNSSAESRHR
jgi:hypothetical protein